MPTPLYSIRGIGRKMAIKFAEAGIHCVEDFCRARDEQILPLFGWSEGRIQRFRKLMEAKLCGIPFRMSNTTLPLSSLSLDIETNPAVSYIWLIGICHKDQYIRFYADKPEEEPRILRQAVEFLMDTSEPILTYSGNSFDAKMLRDRLQYHYKSLLSLPMNRFEDVLKWMNAHLALPLKRYRLKEVGNYFGYKFHYPHRDGLDCALAYVRHLKYHQPIPSWVFRYNEDDTRSVLYLTRKFSHLPIR